MARQRVEVFQMFMTCLVVGICLVSISASSAQSSWPHSPNGEYKANVVGGGSDKHYQVVEVKSGKPRLTTQAEFDTPNDVKAGIFSGDNKYFAAAYHYGHDGSYTWISLWDIETGQRIRTERRSGWVRDLSDVFKK